MRERVRGPERAQESPTPAWTGFYCFSGHITLRMVLIYYAQVHCRWLPFTDNKGKNAANYFKEKAVTAQEGKWLNWLHSILGRFSTDFRHSVNICGFNPRWGSFSKSKPHSSLCTLQAWFPTGEPVCGHGSCVLDLAPTGFSEWELRYVSHTWNSSLYEGTHIKLSECSCENLSLDLPLG